MTPPPMTRKDPHREWHHIGGDLEASYDGSMYVDIRVIGEADASIFISRGALLNAAGLFDPAPLREGTLRVATRWTRGVVRRTAARRG